MDLVAGSAGSDDSDDSAARRSAGEISAGVLTSVSRAALAAADPIRVRGARVHNLRDLDVDIPSSRLVVVTGVSGSGKSSLAFDTLYAEGQRRYVESLSAYARQFLERMDKPEVDEVTGIAPAIAIQQRVPPRNSRSTVGTATELQDYLRLLFARAGTTICPSCDRPVRSDTPGEVADELLRDWAARRVLVAAPRCWATTAQARVEELKELLKQGFRRLVRDGELIDIEPRQIPDLASSLRGLSPAVDVMVDRLRVREGDEARERLVDSLETAFSIGEGAVRVHVLVDADPDNVPPEGTTLAYDRRFRCAQCERDFLLPEPRLFSFNNPYGACPDCKGFGNLIEIDLDKVIPNKHLTLEEGAVEPWTKKSRGRWRSAQKNFCADNHIPMDVAWLDLTQAQRDMILQGGKRFGGVDGFFAAIRAKQHRLHLRVLLARYRGYVECRACDGSRLREEARAVKLGGLALPDVDRMSVAQVRAFFDELQLPVHLEMIVDRVLIEISSRLRYLADVGLEYLTLDRLTGTLSGGEAQRISLATCLGTSLVGSMYVLDEPSIGLHPRDTDRLIRILSRLRDQGNSVIVVEHDRHMIESADHLIDLGPGAGTLGGRLMFSGPPGELTAKGSGSVTAAYLDGRKRVPVPALRRAARGHLTIAGAQEHNLQGLTVSLPLGVLCCVTGVSGSGKSTLVHDVLYAGLRQRLGEWKGRVGRHDHIKGASLIREVVLVDQSPIGRSPRSNPVTYVKAFDAIRKAFAATREARARGYTAGHFSFNVAGGRCDACDGAGEVTVEMQFLPDVRLPCEACGGARYRREILDIRLHGKSIQDVLQLTVAEGRRLLTGIPKAAERLKVLEDVGLGYLHLGQPSSTLSGGEAQRVKLAAHLLSGPRRSEKGVLYLLDEPTTGLHFDDIAKLLFALNRLVDAGASVIVIEHNLDLIKAADWIVDLGPEGGDEGGLLVGEGTPEEISELAGSHTARFLRDALA